MTVFEASLAVYWMSMAVVCSAMAVCRKPLARRLAHQGRGSDPSRSQRFYERSILLVGIGVTMISLTALYGAVVVIPRLDRTLEQIRSTRQLPCPPGHQQAI